jgi:hypothetical protein
MMREKSGEYDEENIASAAVPKKTKKVSLSLLLFGGE